MVKADIRRDYYADLGLTPSADTDDIKRSFRKLALKYHPDRNPGHEVEFNSKFQAIQAANEILSDPQQRVKYDTDRLRAGYRSSYAPKPAPRPPRPPQAAPTPPKPPKPPNNRASYAQWTGPKPAPSGPSPGSQRYSTYARAGPQNWQKPADDAQTRADAFKGFSGMRGNGGSAGWRGFDPQTGRSSAGSTTGGTPRAQAPFGTGTPRAGKSAYETFHDMNSSSPNSANSANSAKKKSGYAPGNAAGDEPPARNTSAYTHNRSERPSSMYFEPAAPPTARKPPPAPEPPHFPPQFPEGMERNRRGYAATGGERTTFSSTPLGRSASARTPSSSAGFRPSNSRTNPPSPDYPLHEEGHYSESPDPRRTKEARRKNHYKNADWTSSSGSDESEEEFDAGTPRGKAQPKPKAIPKSRLRAKQNFSDFHRPENPNPNPATGEDPFNVPRLRRRRDFTPPAPESHPPRYRRDSAIHSSHHQTDADYYEGHNSDSAFSRGSDRPHYSEQSQGSRSREDPSEGTTEKSQTRFGETNGLHKKFSADDWRAHLDNFDFLGASAKRMYSSRASNSPVSGSKPRSRNSLHTDSTDSVPSSKSPGPNMFGSGLGDQPQPPPSDPQQSQAPSPFPFAQAKFSADEWSKQLHDLQWNPPEPETTRKSANNTPPTPRSRKQSRAGAKVRSVPKPASVASELDESTKTVNDDEPASMPAQPAPPEAEAMDIDDELPSPPVNTTPESPTKNGDYPNLSSNVTQEAQAPEPAPPQPPQQTQPPAQHPAQNGVPKEEARAPLFNLDNLRNTAPFTNTTSGGIENLGDVHDTLPFESRAKQQTTTERDIRPRELNLPNPPKRPWAPKLVSMGPNTQVLPIDKWRHYTSAMSAYIYEWNQFNRRMLLHFNTRQEAIETGLSPNWMSAVGDTTRLKLNGDDDDSNDQEPSESDLDEYLVPGSKKGGFSAYVRGIEEDIQVRKHWDVACEMHRECILDLGRLREWIRNGGKLVSFSTV